MLMIYDSTDIFDCFDKIKLQKPLCQIQVSNEFTHGHFLKFDQADKYVLVTSLTQIMIYSIQNDNLGDLEQSYGIDLNKYTSIIDVVICSDHIA